MSRWVIMQIGELIATLQHEVQKSYTFINETRSDVKTEASVLHIALERVEVELPITLAEEEVVFDPKAVKGIPNAIKKLGVPFSPQSVGHKGYLPKKQIKGKSISAEIVGHVQKIDEKVSKETLGRIKVIFKLVVA